MGPFKGEVPVFARLWPVRVRVRVSFKTGAVRLAILATAGLVVLIIAMEMQGDKIIQNLKSVKNAKAHHVDIFAIAQLSSFWKVFGSFVRGK